MNVLIAELLEWSSHHHSVLTTQALRAAGASPATIKKLVHHHIIERMLDGAYRYTGAPLTEEARCVAACQRPSGLVIEGPTAGRLWKVRRMPNDGFVYAIAKPGAHPSTQPWLRAYRTSMLDPRDIVERPDGIRVTSPPRTAVDLSRHLSNDDLRSVIDQMLHLKLATPYTLRLTAEPLATPGRPWARRFLAMLDERVDGRPPESHWESRVVAELRARGITDLVTQRWLEIPGFGNIRLDAAVEALRWGIEVDGHPDHFTETGGARDRDRDLACDAIGWRISRVASVSLRQSFDTAIDRLMAVYQQRRREMR